MPQNELIEDMLREIETLKREVASLRSLVPPYPVWNENTPVQITANQNNYDPGDYAVLRLTTDASRTITGFSGGVKGRLLAIRNAGSNALVLAHESASSDAENRMSLPSGANVTLGIRDCAILYYDSTSQRWGALSIEQ